MNVVGQAMIPGNKYSEAIFRKLEAKPEQEIKCEKCGSARLKMAQVQTRSADEPSTLFITCEECGLVTVN